VDFLHASITALLSDCSELVSYQIWYSWKKVNVLVESVCNPKPDDIPDDVPTCIESNYANPKGVCSASTALECLTRLENEVFAETSTEDRFCV